MSSQSANSVAYNAVESLNAIYSQDLANVANEASDWANLQSQIAYDKSHEYTWVQTEYGGDYKETNYTYQDDLNDNLAKVVPTLNAYNSAVQTLENALGSPQAAELNDAIGAIDAVIGINQPGSEEHNPATLLANANLRNKILGSIEGAIKKLLESDECTQAINAISASGSAQEVSKLASLRNQDLSSINETFGNLESFLYNEENEYTTKLNNAEVANNHYTTSQIWEKHFGLFAHYGYNRIIKHATKMLQSLGNIRASLTSLGSIFSDAEMAQLEQLVNHIITSVKTILENKKLTEKGKVTALLPLMMELLGIYKMIRQATETQKAKNEAQMEKAQTKASEAQVKQSKTDAILQAEIAKDNAVGKIAQDWSTVFNVIIGVAMAAVGSGTAAVAILALTILQATHALGDLETLIAKSIVKDSSKGSPENKEAAKIWAAIIMTTMEVAFTVAAGALGDAAVNSELLMSIIAKTTGKEAVEAGINSAEEAITTAAREATALSTETSSITEEEANTTLRNIAEKAGNTAVKRMYAQLFNQSPLMMAKTLFRQSTKEMFEATVQEAILSSITKAGESGLVLSEEAMDEIATTSASQAVADATKKSAEDISAEGSKSALKSAAQRSGLAALYGIGSTNMLIDIATWGLNHNNKSSTDTSAQALLISLGVIQGAMDAISMMLGSGFMNLANIGENGSSLLALTQRVSAMTETANQAGNSLFNFTQAEIDKTAAKMQYSEQINTTLVGLLQSYLSNFIQEGKAQRSAFIKEQAEETESQNSLVLNLQKGNEEAIRVLTQQAV